MQIVITYVHTKRRGTYRIWCHLWPRIVDHENKIGKNMVEFGIACIVLANVWTIIVRERIGVHSCLDIEPLEAGI